MKMLKGIMAIPAIDEKKVIVTLRIKSTSRRTLKMLLNHPPGQVPTRTIPTAVGLSTGNI